MFRFIPWTRAAVLSCFLSTLSGQIPDYDIGEWAGSDFNSKADHFFQALTLQTSHHHFRLDSSGDRLSLGGTVTTASSFTHSDLTPITGKTGLLPVFEGNLLVTANLSVNGAYAALSSFGDAVIVNRYGMDLFLGSSWLAGLQRCQLEGPDDFFLKTVVVTIIRQTNHRHGKYSVGVSSGFYNAGVHIEEGDDDATVPRALEGGITSLLLGLSRNLGRYYGVHMEAKIHPSFLSLMVGASRTLH